jgi:hypothetical protein
LSSSDFASLKTDALVKERQLRLVAVTDFGKTLVELERSQSRSVE